MSSRDQSNSNKSRRNKNPDRRKWLPIVGLSLLGLATVGLVGAALTEPPTTDTGVGYVMPPESTAEPWVSAAFIGDSYTAGAGVTDVRYTVPSLVGTAERWEVTNLGRGSTGYLTAGSTEGCGLDYCPTYVEMIAEVAATSPQVVVVNGGRNDQWASVRQQTVAVTEFFTTLRASLPEATILVTSPLWDDDPTPASIQAMGAIVQEQAAAVGATYLDLGQPLEGRPELMSADGVHPNDAGHQAIAEATIASIEAAGVAP